MRLINQLLILILSIFIFSCSSGKEVTNPLINDIWILDFVEGVDYHPEPDSKDRPMIEIHLKDNKVTGNTGCNNMNGKVKVNGNEIFFSDIITTEKICEKSIEPEFLVALGMVNNYKIEKLKLNLYRDKEILLVFQKMD
jgi:heat shock protein HslJ